MSVRRAGVAVSVALLLSALVPAAAPASAGRRQETVARHEPRVVVATLDTGTNPFHPTWRRRTGFDHPAEAIRGYPRNARPIRLSFKGSFAENVKASAKRLSVVKDGPTTYWIPGTNIIGLWAAKGDATPIFDPAAADDPNGFYTHGHGASASSQIAGRGFGMGVDAYLVVMDRTWDVDPNSPQSGSSEGASTVNARGLRWAADQPWIDIIHTNIQNPIPLANEETPVFPGHASAVRYALRKGKIVVSAGGNFYAATTETSPHAGPPGVLVAGANDNCGYTDYSNPDPHVVMDGYGTVAAAPSSDGKTTFSGTSSASPRISGYIAQLLLEIRRRYDYDGGIKNRALVSIRRSERPSRGPLADGRLTAAELHEVVRKTANPKSHESKWDGSQGIAAGGGCIPEAPTPFSFYPKMGYGEVSEHTIDDALSVVTGAEPMPVRAVEDAFFEASEELRRQFWD